MVTACAIATTAEGSVRLAKASGRGGGDCLPERLRARLRGHRLKAAELTLSTGPAGLLGQGQKPGCTGGET